MNLKEAVLLASSPKSLGGSIFSTLNGALSPSRVNFFNSVLVFKNVGEVLLVRCINF